MVLKNNFVKVKVGTKENTFEPKRTAKKFVYSTVIVFILQIILNYLQTSTEPILGVTIKSFSVGMIMALINYLKNK